MAALDEEAIFQIARHIERPEARRLYLDQTCGADTTLRARLEALLRVHVEEKSFLEQPAVSPTAAKSGPSAKDSDTTAAHDSSSESAGQLIGPYKLLEVIGEGGMGTVWMAEQIEPVRRRVALKVVKSGMDSKAVVARF